MAGSLRQRGEETWQLRVHVGTDPISRRKRYVSKTFHGTKRQAGRALAELVTETGGFVPRQDRQSTFARLLEEWLEHAAPSLSPKTVVVDGGYVRTVIVPALGAVPVAKLTPVDLDRFYRHLLEVGGPKGPYTPATVKRVHGIVRRALAQGVRWGWLRHNPALDASPPRVPLRPMHPPTPEEVARLFRLAAASNPMLAVFVLVAASTGARRGELVALRWRDLDLERRTATIERGLILAGNVLIEQGTKTHQSRRVSLDEATVAALVEHRERLEKIAAACGVGLAEDPFVFTEAVDASTPWRPDSTTRAFRTLCAKAGVEGVRLHDLRHYVATRLLAAGVDVRTVAGRLGHRNPATTLNVYAHFVPETDQQAAEVLGRMFGEAMGR